MDISCYEKDVILKNLCQDAILESPTRFDANKYAELLDGDKVKLNSILSYYDRIGFISSLNYRYASPEFGAIVRVEASDFVRRGGFTTQEEMLAKEVEKLNLEIKRLKPALGDKIERLSNIAGNLSGIVGTIMSNI